MTQNLEKKEQERMKHLTLINVTVFLWFCSSISNTITYTHVSQPYEVSNFVDLLPNIIYNSSDPLDTTCSSNIQGWNIYN